MSSSAARIAKQYARPLVGPLLDRLQALSSRVEGIDARMRQVQSVEFPSLRNTVAVANVRIGGLEERQPRWSGVCPR